MVHKASQEYTRHKLTCQMASRKCYKKTALGFGKLERWHLLSKYEVYAQHSMERGRGLEDFLNWINLQRKRSS